MDLSLLAYGNRRGAYGGCLRYQENLYRALLQVTRPIKIVLKMDLRFILMYAAPSGSLTPHLLIDQENPNC